MTAYATKEMHKVCLELLPTKTNVHYMQPSLNNNNKDLLKDSGGYWPLMGNIILGVPIGYRLLIFLALLGFVLADLGFNFYLNHAVALPLVTYLSHDCHVFGS